MTEEIPIIVNVRFEWDTEKHEFKLSPKTSIDKLIRRFEKNQKMSGIAFFYGDVELNGTNTFAECNIPEGAILSARAEEKARGLRLRSGVMHRRRGRRRRRFRRARWRLTHLGARRRRRGRCRRLRCLRRARR